ncbi:MAG: adenosylmethionine decarboxylase [Alphaproteobacteria bacterium]
MPDGKKQIGDKQITTANAGPSPHATRANGFHLLADLRIADHACLLDDTRLHQAFKAALQAGGFTIMHDHIQTFPGANSGSTGVFILAESHASWHSYPEADYLALDIFSCGEKDPSPVLEQLANSLPITGQSVRIAPRGPVQDDGKPV